MSQDDVNYYGYMIGEDGYRMYYNPNKLADLFDVFQIFDPARPAPVPKI